MPQLRIALAQLNNHVGDISANADLVVEWCRRADEAGADLVLLPEMVLTGYPVEDLALRQSFVAASRLSVERLASRLEAAGLGDLTAVVGYLDRTDETHSLKSGAAKPQNKAAVLHKGTVVCSYAKHHLPNYGVFDEYRYFRPGNELHVVRVRGVDVGVVICEDLWQDGGPVAAAGEAGVGLLAVVNASPYERNKDDFRGELVARRAREAGATLAYVNLVGGQDELVFDGDSIISDSRGTIIARGPQFAEDLLVADLELPAGLEVPPGSDGTGPSGMIISHHVLSTTAAPERAPIEPKVTERLSDLGEVYAALVLGLGDYCRKNGIQRVYLGLSGGIDSTLTAAIACDAIGADNVYGLSNPSAYSSEHSKSDAAELAERTGLHFSTVPIAPIVDAFHQGLDIDGIAAENLQARIRGVIWMAESNQHGPSIVLACGNKSELAVGYSTIYGDAVGGYAPLKDVSKTYVWKLAAWRNEEAVRRGETPPIPENTISKEPSAELRPGQKDTDSLPPYEILDAILDDYVEGDKGRADLVAQGFDPDLVDRVMRMVDRAEYKRRQYPPGTKISFKAFGRDRRLPITNGWREGR
ncbi:NAD+ synthase [Microlunatus panaciterrae]|uniref:Glutamine-dependent NAD(+) synthetase n=1 Tax=Microlunatus panaciterrae TaxID=400768 RepID=A0ABS2RFW5_9ACTN|nr:NAD+ synthase (glutamine-hydrolyzing) [Microlunatus panaciterrae]